jgi:DNA-binding PucR family transcriptional regulator
MDALAQAYRVGARVAWREMSTSAVGAGLDPATLARLAELVFAYIDELSDASVSGHADELTTSGRLRQRRLDRLVVRLIEGAPEEELVAAAERADWDPPVRLTALIAPEVRIRGARAQLDSRSLHLNEEVTELDPGWNVVLVPTSTARARAAVVRAALDTGAVVGPSAPWAGVRASYQRALQAYRLGLAGDTDQHLATLVVTAAPNARADLRAQVLAPLDTVRPAAREKLTETLRSWLLHQGRRDDVAAALFVHPQTVRYRVGQLRDLYGEKLTDPEFVRDAVIALG